MATSSAPAFKLPRLTPRLATKICNLEADIARRQASLRNREGRTIPRSQMRAETDALLRAVNAKMDLVEYIKGKGFRSQL